MCTPTAEASVPVMISLWQVLICLWDAVTSPTAGEFQHNVPQTQNVHVTRSLLMQLSCFGSLQSNLITLLESEICIQKF